MAEPESLTISYTRRIQLDRYEPVEHGATLNVNLEDEDDWREAYEEYAEQVEDDVERELARRVTETKLAGEEDDG